MVLVYVFLRVIVRIPVQIAGVPVSAKTDGGPEKMFYNSPTETNSELETLALTCLSLSGAKYLFSLKKPEFSVFALCQNK